MANFSGMVAFQVAGGPALAARLTERLQVIHHAVSLGHHRSLIYWIGTDELMASTFRLTGAQLTG
jgi:cystathionine beta-lyase/cystathionine gamma-synthase